MAWDYKRETQARVGAGDHRFEVVSAEEKLSSTNKNMIVVELRPNGASFTVRDYFVEGEYFNRRATSFFDSTNVEDGNFNLLTWTGAVGAARFKEDENGFLKVHYYIDKAKQDKLPAWVGNMPERQTVTQIGEVGEAFDELSAEEDLPF